jgi:wyosine [tRNA(Phe)-imidazoG37] synthetase (radical SAM superfamily)
VHERLAVRGLARAAKIILITNATLLDRPGVGAAIAFLHGHHGEVWAKLDAGTDAYYRRIDRSRVPLGRVLANITRLARRFPVVIQSLFLELDGAGPEAAEIEAYIGRLRGIHQAGGAIEAVQVYTIARGTAHPGVAALDDAALQAIARQIEAAGFAAHVFGAPVASAGG